MFRSPTNSSRIIFGSQSIRTAAAALHICEKTESMKYPGSSRKSRETYLKTSEMFSKNFILLPLLHCYNIIIISATDFVNIFRVFLIFST